MEHMEKWVRTSRFPTLNKVGSHNFRELGHNTGKLFVIGCIDPTNASHGTFVDMMQLLALPRTSPLEGTRCCVRMAHASSACNSFAFQFCCFHWLFSWLFVCVVTIHVLTFALPQRRYVRNLSSVTSMEPSGRNSSSSSIYRRRICRACLF